MWPTIDGPRVLRGQEAELIRITIGQMLDGLVEEMDGQRPPRVYGITWFDQWDWQQKLWLLEQVSIPLFREDHEPPSPAAIYEATIDAIFCHVVAAIQEEIESDSGFDAAFYWRDVLIEAYRCQRGKRPAINRSEPSLPCWASLASQVSSVILVHSSYQQAETLRDRAANHIDRFLFQRALPEDYLQRIPPFRNDTQARCSLESIRQTLKL